MNLFEDDNTETEADLGPQNYSEYNKAVMWSTDWTTETIVSQLKKGNIDLNPSFQRREAWSLAQKSCLIESLILGIPVPPIILAERKDKRNSYIVIDGKQRLLTLRNFYANENEKEFIPLKLTQLKILGDLNGKNIESIKNDALTSEYINTLDNQPIRTIIIRSWPSEKFLYTVFLRLNTGSLKLSPQELRQALHPGQFLNYINEYTLSENPIRNILKLKKPDSRMRDVEFILRYFSFKNFLSQYTGSLKDFLDDSCEQLNKAWEKNENQIKMQLKDLELSIAFVQSIFKENSFKVYNKDKYEKLINRTIFDLFSIYFSEEENRNTLKNKKEDIREAFQNLMNSDTYFKDYTAVSTKNKQRTEYRFKVFNQTMESIKNETK